MTCIEPPSSSRFSSGLSVVTNSLCLTPSFFRFLPSFTPFVPPSTLYDSLLFLFSLYCFYPANYLCCHMTKTARTWLHWKKTEVVFQRVCSKKFPGVNRLKLKKANHRIQLTSGNAKKKYVTSQACYVSRLRKLAPQIVWAVPEGCNYSFMYSWWWARWTPETCGVI